MKESIISQIERKLNYYESYLNYLTTEAPEVVKYFYMLNKKETLQKDDLKGLNDCNNQLNYLVTATGVVRYNYILGQRNQLQRLLESEKEYAASIAKK